MEMMSASLMTLTIFMFLPGPIKLLLLFFGSVFLFGKADVRVEGAHVVPEVKKEARLVVPAVAEKEIKKPDMVMVINVKVDGTIVVDNKQLTKAELTKKLAATQKNAAIQVRGDAKAEYKKIVEVVDISQKAGISNISFATRIETQTQNKP